MEKSVPSRHSAFTAKLVLAGLMLTSASTPVGDSLEKFDAVSIAHVERVRSRAVPVKMMLRDDAERPFAPTISKIVVDTAPKVNREYANRSPDTQVLGTDLHNSLRHTETNQTVGAKLFKEAFSTFKPAFFLPEPPQGCTLTSTPPSVIDFSYVAAGTKSIQTPQLTANGCTITISGKTVSGTGYSVANMPGSIAEGITSSYKVQFAPAAAGITYPGSLSITNNGTDNPLMINLEGTGMIQHKVLISWTAGCNTNGETSNGVTVFRSNQNGGPYSQQNATLVSDTAQPYIDATVLSNNTYYFVLTCTTSTGQASGYSTQMIAVIPFP